MKFSKILIIAVILSMFCTGIFAQSNAEQEPAEETTVESTIEQKQPQQFDLSFVNFFSDQVTHKASIGQEARNYYDFNNYTLDLSLRFLADMKEIKFETGMNIGYYGLNLVYDATYAPTLFDVLNVGLRAVHHFDWSTEDYYDFDFLGGLYVEYNPFDQLQFKGSFLYHRKCALVFAIEKERGFIRNNGFAMDLSCNYQPVDWFNATISMSSFNFFRYYLFFSPIFSVTTEFKLNDFLSLSITGEAQFVDFFCLSANFNNLCSIISIGWRF